MAKVRRNRLLAVMIAVTFVVVQFIDLAVLDNQHAEAAVAHSDWSGKPAGQADDSTSGAEHCACHMLHHGFTGTSSDHDPIYLSRLARPFIMNARYANLTSLPPVPPPIS